MKENMLRYIDYNHYSDQLKELSGIVSNIVKYEEAACIIKNFPISDDNTQLIIFSELLGKPITEKRNIDGKTVYRVEASETEIPSYSNTNYEFPCHTDCSDFENPPDTVILLCEIQSEYGGDSYLITLEEVLEKLSIQDIILLKKAIFPQGNKFIPILYETNGEYTIRYNPITIELYSRYNNIELPEEIKTLLDKVNLTIEENKLKVKLSNNDCLIINNTKILHGRSRFNDDSPRLLKRLRLNLY